MRPAIHYAIIQDAKRDAKLRRRMINRIKAPDFGYAMKTRIFKGIEIVFLMLACTLLYCVVASAIVGGHHGR